LGCGSRGHALREIGDIRSKEVILVGETVDDGAEDSSIGSGSSRLNIPVGSLTVVSIIASDVTEDISELAVGIGLLLGVTSSGAELALDGTALGAEDALGVTALLADTALSGTSTLLADLALSGTSSVADLALEVTATSVADEAHGVTSGDSEGASRLGAHDAVGVTSTLLAEPALGVTGGLIGLSGLEDDVVTGEGKSLLGHLEGTDDGVDDLLGGSGLDTEDLHVAVGSILGEGDEVLGGDLPGGELRDGLETLVLGGLDGLSVGGDEDTVLDVRLLGGLVGDESKSEDGSAESSGEHSRRNEHLLSTVEATSESLDGELEASEGRATSGFEFHF
jgi:hypothetical protein